MTLCEDDRRRKAVIAALYVQEGGIQYYTRDGVVLYPKPSRRMVCWLCGHDVARVTIERRTEVFLMRSRTECVMCRRCGKEMGP